MSTTEATNATTYHVNSLVKASDLKADATFSQYMNLRLTVSSSAASPANIVIYVGGSDAGYPVIFSLGDERSRSSGLQVQMVGDGSLPLKTLVVAPNTATLNTLPPQGSSNTWSLQMQGYLGAQPGTRGLLMYAIIGDNSTSVSVSLNNGGYTPLVQTPTLFQWDPIN